MDHVQYYNDERPAYALDYNTPVQYRIEQGYCFICLFSIDKFTRVMYFILL